MFYGASIILFFSSQQYTYALTRRSAFSSSEAVCLSGVDPPASLFIFHHSSCFYLFRGTEIQWPPTFSHQSTSLVPGKEQLHQSADSTKKQHNKCFLSSEEYKTLKASLDVLLRELEGIIQNHTGIRMGSWRNKSKLKKTIMNQTNLEKLPVVL